MPRDHGALAPRRRARAIPGVLAACAVLVACGSSGRARAPAPAALFREACGSCHSLDGRTSPTHQGGDLLAYRFGRAALLQFAREMPVRRRLDAGQLASVVDYVARAERDGRAP